MYTCPRNSDNKEKCRCRITSDRKFECVKPNAWNEFRREHIGKYTQRELSLEYKKAKRHNYHVNLCSSRQMDKTCGLGVIKYASANMALELLGTTPAITLVQKERKWLQAYSPCKKIRWPPVTAPHGMYKDTLLRQCARIIDRTFFNGAVLKHLLTFDRNAQTSGNMYWDPCFREADPKSLGVLNGVAVSGIGRHPRKGRPYNDSAS